MRPTIPSEVVVKAPSYLTKCGQLGPIELVTKSTCDGLDNYSVLTSSQSLDVSICSQCEEEIMLTAGEKTGERYAGLNIFMS